MAFINSDIYVINTLAQSRKEPKRYLLIVHRNSSLGRKHSQLNSATHSDRVSLRSIFIFSFHLGLVFKVTSSVEEFHLIKHKTLNLEVSSGSTTYHEKR
jgi:hypothetical protein